MFYWVVKAVLTPFLRTFWRPWVEGLEHVPAEGAAILAGNHLSFLDSIFLPLVVPRRVTFLAKSDYFTESGIKGWFKRRFFSGVGQVPIDRSGGKASEAALRSGVKVLKHDRLLGIYPEGTRSPDGRLYRGKIGVAKMAIEASVPVVPVAMIGTFEVQPPGKFFPKIKRVGIRIGPPLDFARYRDMADDRYVLRSITDEIMYEVMQLSGQEYVDTYAQRAREDIAAARAAAVEAAGGTHPDIAAALRRRGRRATNGASANTTNTTITNTTINATTNAPTSRASGLSDADAAVTGDPGHPVDDRQPDVPDGPVSGNRRAG